MIVVGAKAKTENPVGAKPDKKQTKPEAKKDSSKKSK